MTEADRLEEGQGLWDQNLLYFETLGSTNRWAMEHLDRLNAGDVVVAALQDRGKGRRGRQWMTPEGGLAVSIVLHYPEEAETAPLLGQAAALGVALWLEKQGLEPGLKWPNDVLVNHKKIAGILSEARPAAGKAVIGIGLNVNVDENEALRWQPRWPATSLLIESKQVWVLEEVRRGLLLTIAEVLGRLEGEGFSALRDDWHRLDALKEMNLVVDTTEKRIEGQYEGMDELGRLLLRRSKKTLPLAAGDVVCIYKRSQ